MRVRLLYTDGQGEFKETAWDKPEPGPNEIEVRAVMTGICRSDIDMMQGNFGPLPLSMQGHEGLGQVTKVGESIVAANMVKIGDYVATRGEPAFADYYNVRQGEFVTVPEASPKYIIEPVACAVNIVDQLHVQLSIQNAKPRILILGSGFLAWIVFQALALELSCDVTVVGNSNRQLWNDHIQLSSAPNGKYDVVIDLKPNDTVFTQDILNENAIIMLAAEKKPGITTNFSNLLWKNCTIVCPSPRNTFFILSMVKAAGWIMRGQLQVDDIWTRGYNRNTEWQQAFADGANRPAGYSRGYLLWD